MAPALKTIMQWHEGISGCMHARTAWQLNVTVESKKSVRVCFRKKSFQPKEVCCEALHVAV
jgi:hypothetical protein